MQSPNNIVVLLLNDIYLKLGWRERMGFDVYGQQRYCCQKLCHQAQIAIHGCRGAGISWGSALKPSLYWDKTLILNVYWFPQVTLSYLICFTCQCQWHLFLPMWNHAADTTCHHCTQDGNQSPLGSHGFCMTLFFFVCHAAILHAPFHDQTPHITLRWVTHLRHFSPEP